MAGLNSKTISEPTEVGPFCRAAGLYRAIAGAGMSRAAESA